MSFVYDQEADAAYLAIHDAKVAKTIPIDDETIIDVDVHGDVVGIEFLSVKIRKGSAKFLEICSVK